MKDFSVLISNAWPLCSRPCPRYIVFLQIQCANRKMSVDQSPELVQLKRALAAQTKRLEMALEQKQALSDHLNDQVNRILMEVSWIPGMMQHPNKQSEAYKDAKLIAQNYRSRGGKAGAVTVADLRKKMKKKENDMQKQFALFREVVREWTRLFNELAAFTDEVTSYLLLSAFVCNFVPACMCLGG